MAIPSTPEFWPMSLGAAADVVGIPAQTPAGQGIPSFQELFPTLTAVDPAAGGYFIEREWMNGLFQLLGSNLWYLQHGGRFAWTSSFDYPVGAVVVGSNGRSYQAAAVSGPESGGAVDPVNDTSGSKWTAMPDTETERWRKSMIGSLVPMTSSTLPEGFGLPDGSLFLFEDYPELKEKYDAGGFNGMTLEANASAEDKAAWVGKWVKHPQGLGLYAPRLSGLFLRNAGSEGAYNAPGIPDFTGGMGDVHVGAVPSASGACRWYKTGSCQELSINTGIWNYGNFSVTGSLSHPVYGASSSVMPASADVSMGLYLGRLA